MSEAGRYAPLKQTHEQVAQNQSAPEADQQQQQQQPSQSPPVHRYEIDDEITRDTRELQRKVAEAKERFPDDPRAVHEVIHQHQVQDNQKAVAIEAEWKGQTQANGNPAIRGAEVESRVSTQAADLSQGLKGNQQPDQSQSKEPTDEQKRRALELTQGVETRQQQQEQALAKGQEQQQSHER